VAKPELGLKRECMTCGARFYDLNRSPITCPKCGTPFQAAPLTRTPAPVAARTREAEEPEPDAAGPELVPLADVEADEAGQDTPVDDTDIGGDIADDTFLEEEEQGEDDMSGLIEGDFEDDEEA